MKFVNRAKEKALNSFHSASIRAAVAGGLALAGSTAMAQGTYDGLTTAVDWSDVGTGLLAVGTAIIGIMVTFKGIKLITRAVKGA